ncbi:MAG: DUF6438 domain-containing protein [Saprospiraceae bacterium]
MQKMTTYVLLAAIAVIAIAVFTQCTPTKTTGTTPPPTVDQNAKLIALSSGACFGTCPVFTMTTKQNGAVEYAGDRFTDKLGIWSMQLNDTQLKELKTLIGNANLLEMQDEYKSTIADMPYVKVTYFEGDKEKGIGGKENRPQALRAIEKQMRSYVEMEGWKLEKAPDFGLAAGEIANEIIVQLKDGVSIDQFMEENNTRFLQLKMKERVTPNMNYYVVTYAPSVYGPKATLQQFKDSELTVDASFNKQTKLRE